ncbi:MAG: DNA adenine methylase [Lachnospiraceae bacterium]|nr:DNA adenine methylase [Lachnospiraceae bacterium]
MNYIGSKLSLLDFIGDNVDDVTNGNYSSVCDLFAGTGIVGRYFKKKGKTVIANDLQYYSYVLNRHYIGNNHPLVFSSLTDLDVPGIQTSNNRPLTVCDYLSGLEGVSGFIYNNYCLGGSGERLYYSDENGKLCDAIRIKIESWKSEKKITEDEYYYLLCTLLESIDKVANTASVYGAFLKNLKESATKRMKLAPAELILSEFQNTILNDDANVVAASNPVDVLYLDPPYNQRQYATNYHLLETIARYDDPKIHGKTGLREYSAQKSKYCARAKVKYTFDDLIMNSKAKYIFLSYNNEGLLPLEEIKTIMSKRGKYGFVTRDYHRFKADGMREYSADSTVEYLHYVICDQE